MLDAAARSFARQGYHGTSIRDIAAEVGVQPSSLYYFFRSKDDLFEAVYQKGMEEMQSSVEAAIATADDPWTRLERAAMAHLQSLLTSADYNTLVANIVPRGDSDLNRRLIRHRDSYEKVFIRLIKELPLPPRTDRRMFRLAVLGALNFVVSWYRPGGATPKAIARKIIRMFRRQMDPQAED